MSVLLPSTIDIAATPEQVWEVLVDFDSYDEWSNFSRVSGTAEEGTRLSIRMPGMSFRPYVTAADPIRKLEWSAKIGTERLFVGRHTFTLAGGEGGATTVTNSETFSGALVWPFGWLFSGSKRGDGYTAFNRALKTRVETRQR